jgi:asparagine synthase (glutamine-hydrolysing)
MCGICGYVGVERRPLKAATDSLRHRGPDDHDLWEGQLGGYAVGLGHRRLSIIDLSPLGRQPMATADGQLRVVFNGEIYNFKELRGELEKLGHVFRSHSDTEVVLEGYRRWGDAVVERLRGMFAFAVVDGPRARVLLARDRLGIKPLYVRSAAGSLLFASELKGILAMLPERPQLDRRTLRAYLTYLYVPAPRSIFEGVGQLEPGERAVFENGELRRERYWRLPAIGPSPDRREVVAELRALLEETVRLHLISDVPLGAFLSGGLDSTTLVALMARASSRPVKTFCMTFEPDAGLYDERQYARAVAERYGTEHTEIPVRPDLAELLPAAVRHFDEPFGNPTSLLVWALSQKTRESVTVALAGDGGDEVFLGYPRYQGAALSELYRRTPARMRKLAARLSSRIPESTRGRHELRRAREFLHGGALGPDEMYAEWVTYFTTDEQRGLLTEEALEGTAGFEPLESLRGKLLTDRELVDRCQALDLQTFLPGNLLTYSDRMSMAHGLEVRVPFCDHRLVERMASLPASLKMPRLRTKALLREAVADLLPPEVQGRRKLGFNPPVGIWLRGPLRGMLSDVLMSKRCRERGLFQPEAVTALMRELDSGRRDRSLHLWALLNFELWAREYLDSPAARA